MLVHQLAQGLSLIGLLAQGLHLDWQVSAQEQVRAGDSVIPGVAGSNTISASEIISPSVQGHLTAQRGEQDLFLRYQPRFLDTFEYIPQAGHFWTGWTQMHRVMAQYQVGNERDLKLRTIVTFAAGKLDLTEPSVAGPDGLVMESGFMPGRLGQLINYTSVNGTLSLTHRMGRWLRLSTTETLGFLQYPATAAIGFFGNQPGAKQSGPVGNETQYRINSRNEVELILGQKDSLFADGEVLDASYRETASYPGFMVTGGYGRKPSPLGHLRVDAGIMKYWTNPAPGIILKPKFMPIASVTFDHTFVSWGMPHLSAHVIASIKPYFNPQFSSVEPRTTLQLQLTYAASKRLSVLSSARLLSSSVGSFTHWQNLPGGHPKNIFLLNVGLHYNWREILILDCSAYGSDLLYKASATNPYAELRQVYVMIGLRGSWQSTMRGSHG